MMQQVYTYDPYSGRSSIPIPAPVAAPIGTPVGAVIPGGAVAGQMPNFGGLQYVLVKDPMDELNSCTSVTIRQQPELLETITGCETANRYHVFGVCQGVYKYYIGNNYAEFMEEIYRKYENVINIYLNAKKEVRFAKEIAVLLILENLIWKCTMQQMFL